jgi:hypothetical protein
MISANNNPNSDDDENTQIRTLPKKSKEIEESPNAVIRFIRNNPIIFVLILSIIIILVVLAIVLPLTLIKPKSERPIKPRCPDGKFQQRVDCLPDKGNLLNQGLNLESACSQRGCCWTSTPEAGGPSCAFHFNYGYRQFKTKESGAAGNWYELVRMEAPQSLARSDIANLEFKLEMHTDHRLRIKVHLIKIMAVQLFKN